MSLPLDAAQRACLVRGRHLAVVAGAGSGKTRVLVERYMALLADYGPEEIVAITFTRKAAAEIKTRVRERLLEDLETARPAAVPALRRALEGLGAARIGTIDGFFAEVLREAPLDGGLDLGFEVAAETHQAWLLEEALAGELRELAAAPLDSPGRLALVEALDASGGRRGVEARLRVLMGNRRLLRRLAGLGAAGLQAAWDEARARDLVELAVRLRADQELITGVTEGGWMADGAEPEDELAALLAGLAKQLGRLQAGDDAAAIALVEPLFTAVGSPRRFGRTGTKKAWKGGGLEEARELASALAARAGRYRDRLVSPAEPAVEAATAALGAALATVAAGVEARYLELARSQGLVDFQDLDMAVERLLGSPSAARVMARLRARFRVFLLDEMQDTNPVQWGVLKSLALGPDGEGEAFLVGDPKQAIYGFRRADVRTFLGACADLESADAAHGTGPAARLLARNYRSAPEVLAFVNGFFGPLMAEDDGGFEVPFAALEPSDQAGGGTVGMLLVPPAGEDEKGEEGEEGSGGAALEAELIARQIAFLVRGPEAVALGGIAILLRRRAPLLEIEAALRRHGLAHRVHGGIGFYQRQEVRDLVSLARVLADPCDDLALVALLRSPFFALPDEALLYLADRPGSRWWARIEERPGSAGAPLPEALARSAGRARALIRSWLSRAGRIPPAELLRRAADEGGLWVALRGDPEAKRALANVEKLLDVVRELPGDLAEVAAYLRRLVDAEEGEGEAGTSAAADEAVSIMTIHAAKGLEFETVFVPDLARRFQSRADQGIALDPDGLVGLAAPDWCAVPGELPPRPYGLKRALRRRTVQERAEEKRLFYVAATRAKRRLYLVGTLAGPEAPAPEAARSWLDWLRAYCGPGTLPLGTDPPGEVAAFGLRIPLVLDPGQIPEAPRPTEEDLPRLVDRLAERPPPAEGVSDRPRLPGRLAALSATALLDRRCPRRFALRQLVGLDPSALAGLVEPGGGHVEAAFGGGAGAGARARGTRFHEAVEALLSNRPGAAGPPPPAPGVPAIEGSESETRALLATLEADPLWARIRAAPRRLVEESFTIRIGETRLSGAIDLAFEETDGAWTVVDWKTNRPPGSGALEPWVWAKAREYELQLLAYALALEARGLRPGRVGLWLARAGRLWERPLASGELAACRADLEGWIRAIEAGKLGRADADPDDPITAATCRTCPVLRFCSEALDDEDGEEAEGGGEGVHEEI